MNVNRRSIAQEFVDRAEVQVPAPPFDCRASEDDLRDVPLANELRNRFRHRSGLESYDLCSNILCETDVCLQGLLVRFRIIESRIDIDDEQFGIEAMRHSGGARDQMLCGGIRTDANCKTLPHAEIALWLFLFEVGLETAVDLLRHLPQSKFAKRDQVTRTEEVS